MEEEVKTDVQDEPTKQPEPKAEPAKTDDIQKNLTVSDDENTELEEFRKWKESQKSDAEKQAAAIAKAEKARLDAESKISDYEAKFIALKNGVSADSIDDVIALAKVKVSKTVTLEQAVSAVLEKYPQFSNKQITTGIHTNNNSTSSISGVEAAFLAKNPDLKI